jgi:hypothetical protein
MKPFEQKLNYFAVVITKHHLIMLPGLQIHGGAANGGTDCRKGLLPIVLESSKDTDLAEAAGVKPNGMISELENVDDATPQGDNIPKPECSTIDIRPVSVPPSPHSIRPAVMEPSSAENTSIKIVHLTAFRQQGRLGHPPFKHPHSSPLDTDVQQDSSATCLEAPDATVVVAAEMTARAGPPGAPLHAADNGPGNSEESDEWSGSTPAAEATPAADRPLGLPHLVELLTAALAPLSQRRGSAGKGGDIISPTSSACQ